MVKALVPDVQRLESLREQGMTHREMAAWIAEHEGVVVAPGSIASKLSRAGRTQPRPRYREHLPWHVKAEHQQRYPAKMLRLLAQRDNGRRLTKQQNDRLNSWLARLAREHAIVAYAPHTPEGFHYIDGDFAAIPIRQQPVLPRESP